MRLRQTATILVAAGVIVAVGAIGFHQTALAHPSRDVPAPTSITPYAPGVAPLPANVYDKLFNVPQGANPHLRITSAIQSSDGGWTVCQHAFVPRKGPVPMDGKPRPLEGHNTICFVIPHDSKTWTYAHSSGPSGPPEP